MPCKTSMLILWLYYLFSNLSLHELFSNYGNSYFSFKLINNFQTRKFHLKLGKIPPENVYEMPLMYIFANILV